jgi:hypothetical protein
MKGPTPFYGYPKTYFYRGRSSQHTKFIMSRMAAIPESLKLEVSEQYERLFKGGAGVKEANEYLNAEAMKYRK